MKQLLAVLCAALALGLVAAGCGGDDDDGAGDGGGAATTEQTATTDETTTGDEPGSGEDAAGEQIGVEIVDIDYEPREATVPAGATVKWTNTGNLPHTVTKEAGPGPDFDSGTVQPGDTFEQTFDAPGRIEYLCTIHSGQEGSLTVE